MKYMQLALVIALVQLPRIGLAAMEDEPLLFNLKADEFETADTGDRPLLWDAQAWLGKDLNKLWFKSEGERLNGEMEELELQALYSKAVSTYWDFQAGVRHDFEPSPQRSWAVVGMQGLAPYFFEVDTALFLSEEGDVAFRLNAEYELMLTQRLILSPDIEMNFYHHNIPELGLGSGLADMKAGLRLRYEIRREFAPYIGISWKEKFGTTADFSSLEGEDISDTAVVAGIRFWF